TTTSTTLSVRAFSKPPTCRTRRSQSSGTRVRGGSTRSCTTSSSAPPRRATSSRARRSAPRCSLSAHSCSNASTSARTLPPSFGVSPDRGLFKCFGCGEGGDAIAFVKKVEQVDFVGAIEWLADRFNVQLEYEESSPEEDRKRRHRERLYALLERAAGFYERYLWESETAAHAREYLASRGLGEEVCREFRLGLAPREPTLARRA